MKLGKKLALAALAMGYALAASAEPPASPDPFSIDLSPDTSAIQSGGKPPAATPQNPSPVSTVVQNLNPDLSIVGDFLGGNPAALDLPGEGIHRPVGIREIEIDGSGYVSPYAKAFFVTSFEDDAAGVEEAYMDFFNLPAGLDLKMGKMLVDLDTLNSQHPHAFPFVDRPLMLRHAYGPEGLEATGANASILIPNPWDHYLVLSSTVAANPANEDQFSLMYGGSLKSIFYAERLGSSWDFGPASYLNVDATATLAPLTDGSLTRILESDFLFRYAPDPANNAISILGGYLWGRGRPLQVDTVTDHGYYVYSGWQFSPRWRIGARYDQTDFAAFNGKEQQVSGILSFYPTETNYLRIQYARHELPPTDALAGFWENQIWFQVDFSIGPHRAHTAL